MGFSANDAIIDGQNVTFPSISLPSESSLTVKIPAGFFQDENGNPSPECHDWSIETPDVTGPEIAEGGLTPSGEGTPEGTTFPITMKFTENIEMGSGSVVVYNKATGAIFGTYPANSLTVEGSEASILLERLDEQTEYYVLVDSGIVKDSSGNEFSGISNSQTWEFKTKFSGVGIEDPEATKAECNLRQTSDGQRALIIPNKQHETVTVSVFNKGGQLVTEKINLGKPSGTIDIRSYIPRTMGVYTVYVTIGNKQYSHEVLP